MAKRSYFEADFESGVTVSEVVLRSQYPGIYKAVGPVTGTMYIFPKMGSEVKVHVSDSDYFLKKIRKGCCGAPDSPYFVLVK